MIPLVVSMVLAHQAPSGWWYDPFCCGGQDCHPVVGVVVTGDGFVVAGELMAGNDPRILPSQDDAFHLCQDETGIHCLYVPGKLS